MTRERRPARGGVLGGSDVQERSQEYHIDGEGHHQAARERLEERRAQQARESAR
jgi:hypothetical protein